MLPYRVETPAVLGTIGGMFVITKVAVEVSLAPDPLGLVGIEAGTADLLIQQARNSQDLVPDNLRLHSENGVGGRAGDFRDLSPASPV